jgi:hypothetical protein
MIPIQLQIARAITYFPGSDLELMTDFERRKFERGPLFAVSMKLAAIALETMTQCLDERGYTMVPMNPSEKMIAEAEALDCCTTRSLWRVMVDIAPEIPS